MKAHDLTMFNLSRQPVTAVRVGRGWSERKKRWRMFLCCCLREDENLSLHAVAVWQRLTSLALQLRLYWLRGTEAVCWSFESQHVGLCSGYYRIAWCWWWWESPYSSRWTSGKRIFWLMHEARDYVDACSAQNSFTSVGERILRAACMTKLTLRRMGYVARSASDRRSI